MSTHPRIVLRSDRSQVLDELLLSKTASQDPVKEQLDDADKAESKAQSEDTKERKRAGLSDADVVEPIVVQSNTTGEWFYKNPGQEFEVQGPFESMVLARAAAQIELEEGPRQKTAGEFPEFEAQQSRTAEVDDRPPMSGKGENKKGPQTPEINTTEESAFGGPTQVKRQYGDKTAAEDDSFPGNSGEELQGAQKARINTPKEDQHFDGNEGQVINGPHTPIVNTKSESEFGGPVQVK